MLGAVPYLLHALYFTFAFGETEINQIHDYSMDRYTMNIAGIVETDKIFSKIRVCLVLFELSKIYNLLRNRVPLFSYSARFSFKIYRMLRRIKLI